MVATSSAVENAIARRHLEFAEIASVVCGVVPGQLVPIIESLARRWAEPTWVNTSIQNWFEATLEGGVPLRGDENFHKGGLNWSRTPGFIPLVWKLVQIHGPDTAHVIVKGEDLDRLVERDRLLHRLFRMRHFLTREELAIRAEAFIHYLKQNRQHLVTTGYPTTRFTSWPAPLACSLYPVKLPRNLFEDSFTNHAMVRQHRQFVEERPPHLWCSPRPMLNGTLSPNGHEVTEGSLCPAGTIPCDYENSPLIGGLDANDARRLEDGRSALLELRIRVFERLAQALQRGSATGLWEDCLRLLTDTLLGRDADFYLRMDHQRGPELTQTGQLARFNIEEVLPGGLTELLEVIGYCEKELTIGTMDRAKRALEPVSDPDETDPYFSALGSSRRATIDAALDALEDRNAQEAAIWREFQARVNAALQNAFAEEVVFRMRVKRAHAAQFEPRLKFLAEWTRDHLEQSGTLPDLQLSHPRPVPANHFRREGKTWTLAFDRVEVHPENIKGLHYIQYLLQRPGQPIHVLELVRAVEGTAVSADATDHQRSDTLLEEIGASGEGFGDAGPIADDQARRELRQRLQEIDEEIAEAEEFGDSDGAEALRGEKDFILKSLRQAFGLGGRKRVTRSADERARSSVAKAIGRALNEIKSVHPLLSEHLGAITTGTFCCYAPPGASPPVWEY